MRKFEVHPGSGLRFLDHLRCTVQGICQNWEIVAQSASLSLAYGISRSSRGGFDDHVAAAEVDHRSRCHYTLPARSTQSLDSVW